VRSVDWIFIVGAPAWRCLGEYVTWGKTFYSLLLITERIRDFGQKVLQSYFQTGICNSRSYCHICFLIVSLGTVIRKIVILCINCVIITRVIIITRVNDDNAVINNYRRLHLILLSNFSMGT